MEMECVHCKVRTKTLSTMKVKFSLEKHAAFRGAIGSYGRFQTRVIWVL
jgi:hypothetical protein